jgi:hypothetical protein
MSGLAHRQTRRRGVAILPSPRRGPSERLAKLAAPRALAGTPTGVFPVTHVTDTEQRKDYDRSIELLKDMARGHALGRKEESHR